MALVPLFDLDSPIIPRIMYSVLSADGLHKQ